MNMATIDFNDTSEMDFSDEALAKLQERLKMKEPEPELDRFPLFTNKMANKKKTFVSVVETTYVKCKGPEFSCIPPEPSEIMRVFMLNCAPIQKK